jgi:hypothetical protein
MSSPSGAPEKQDEEFIKVAAFVLILAILAIAVIASQQNRINAFIGAVTILHVLPFAEMVRLFPITLEIPFLGSWLFRMSAAAHDFLLQGGFSEMTPVQRNATLTAGGRAALVIYGPFMIWVVLRGRDFRVDRKYRRRHSLESMIWAQSENWMTSRISRHVNPLKETEIDARTIAGRARSLLDAAKGETSLRGSHALPGDVVSLRPGTWGRALRPEEWLIANGLVFDSEVHDRIIQDGAICKDTDFEFRNRWKSLDVPSLSEVLGAQLRTPWKGPEGIRPCFRAIFAVMAQFYDYDVDGGNKLLFDLGILADATRGKPGSMDQAILAEAGMMARIDKIVSGKAGKKLTRMGEGHAWLESAFPAFLTLARKDRGVLPPAAFLWLKAEDRLMWYILDNVGNEAVMIEAAGALAHCRAELQIGKPIRRPAVYQAARALLEDYLDVTPDRLKSRAEKEGRTRTPGQQVDLLWTEFDAPPSPQEDG